MIKKKIAVAINAIYVRRMSLYFQNMFLNLYFQLPSLVSLADKQVSGIRHSIHLEVFFFVSFTFGKEKLRMFPPLPP